MYIDRLILKNVGMHRSFDQTFSRGLAWIVGPNGSGKSTVTNAIYAGLTNDFSRFNTSKREGCINIRAGEKEESYISVHGEHDGLPFVLTRKLRGKPKQSLQLGNASYDKAEEIEAVLQDFFGISMDLLGRYVFVDQGAIAAFLTMTPTELAKSFHELCDTESSEQAWETLGRRATACQGAINATPLPDLTLIRQRIAEAKADVKTESERLEAASKSLLTAERHQELTQLLRQYSQLPSAKQGVKTAEADLATRESQVVRFRAKVREATKLAEEAQIRVEVADGHFQKCREGLAQAQQVAKAWEDYDNLVETRDQAQNKVALLSKQVKTLAAQLPAAPEMTTSYDEIPDVLAKLRHDLEHAESVVSAAEDSSPAICPTCGQDLPRGDEVPPERLEAAKSQIAALRPQIQALAAQKKSWADYLKQKNEHESKAAKLQNDLSQAQGRLQGLPEAVKPRQTRSDAEAIVLECEVATNLLDEAKNTESAAKKAVEVAQKALSSAEGELTALQRSLAERQQQLVAIQDEIDASGLGESEAKQLVDAHTQAAGAKQSAEDSLKKANARLAREKRALADAKAAALARKEQEALVDYLVELREVLHRNNFPRQMAARRLRHMEQAINETLDDFGNPFTVQARDDLSLWIQKPGSKPEPAKQLSKGQQVVLSMAYRRAVNRTFARQLGLLVLDEPTVFLDADNVGSLRVALRRFASETSQHQFQMLVITHEESLLDSLGKVIRTQVEA